MKRVELIRTIEEFGARGCVGLHLPRNGFSATIECATRSYYLGKAMNRITVAPNLSSQLDRLTQPVELCDEHGSVLGHFVPRLADDPAESCPYSADELLHLRTVRGGRPLAEIWRSMAEK